MTGHNVTVEDSSPTVVYRDYSLWEDSPPNDPNYDQYSGPSQSFNSFHITNFSTSVDFAFNGSAIYVFGSVGPTHGPFTVILTPDNTPPPPGSISGHRPTEITNSTGLHDQLFQVPLYSRTGLDKSVPHLITITNSGQGQFILDYFIVETEVGESNSTVKEYTIDDTHPAFTYPVGAWDTDHSDLEKTSTGRAFLELFNNETSHSARDIGAQATLTFRGSGVSLHGVWCLGGFFVRVDNRPTVEVKSSNNGSVAGVYNRPRELLFTVDGLDEGMHTITLTNAQAADLTQLDIDYAVVSTANPKNLDGVTPPSGGGSKDDHTPSGGRSATHLGPIIGGTVGGAIFLALTIVALWFWRRRRQKKARERIDLLAEVDDASERRRANEWIPWRLGTRGEGVLGRRIKGQATMSSLSGLASRVSYDATVASASSVNAMNLQGVIEDHSRDGTQSMAIPSGTSSSNDGRSLSDKQRRVPELPAASAPRHADDAGVTLLRAGSVRTLPPLYNPGWDNVRQITT